MLIVWRWCGVRRRDSFHSHLLQSSLYKGLRKVQLQIAMSQDVCPPEKGTPCQLGTQLAGARRVLSIHVCCLKLCLRCIQPGFLLTLVGICSYLNEIGRLSSVLAIPSQMLLTSLAKKNQPDTLSSWSRPDLTCFSSPSTFLQTAHKVSPAPCRLPSSNKLWHWRGTTVVAAWWQTLRRGTTVGVPGHAGQLSNTSHNLPTHLPVHSWSTQEASLEINLMFGEITTLLQIYVKISSSIHLGHSAILLCLPGLKIWNLITNHDV